MSVFGTIPEDEFVLYGTVRQNPLRACRVTDQIAPLKVRIELSRIDEALEAFRDVSEIARRSPGILYFCIAQDDIEPTVFHAHERYTGREAFEDHQKNETVVKFFNSGMIIEAKPKLLKPIG